MKPLNSNKSDKSRRISSRGSRKSNLLNGLVHPPHSSIPPNEYYKFINDQLPEPIRLQQLLYWCILHSLNTATDHERVVLTSLMDGLVQKNISCSWYTLNEPEIVGQQHPENAILSQNINELKQKLNEYENEIKQWKDLENNLIIDLQYDFIEDEVQEEEKEEEVDLMFRVF